MSLTVGVADLKLGREEDGQIITHALGSCLGITIYDPVAKVGGMLHAMLPLSTIDTEKAKRHPYMYVDTGVPRLFLESYKLGAKKERIILTVAGGAQTREGDGDFFAIGKRNMVMLRKLLWKNGVLIKAEETGGTISRTMTLRLTDGAVILRTAGADRELLGPARVERIAADREPVTRETAATTPAEGNG